jgi:hypothetical protein
MTKQEIRDLFDSKPNMTVAQLARIAGKPSHQIVKILMEKQ